MVKAIFTGGLRTPFGRAFKGAFKDTRADDLLLELLSAQQLKFPSLWESAPDDLILGCAYPEHEQGYNLGRIAALGCGLDVPGMTVNRLCASSLEAVAIAAARIQSGWGRAYLTAGLESMSRIPRRGANFSESDRVKRRNPRAYTPNGETAERVAQAFGHISREAQEQFAGLSHQNAAEAYQAGYYLNQLSPFLIEQDEFIRVPVDYGKMASLPPAFAPVGVVTAATSSPLTDGATTGWVWKWERLSTWA